MVALLSESAAEVLRAAPLTYDEVGATAGPPPPGYGHLERSRSLPGRDFEAGAERLMGWQVHEAAGLRVTASELRVELDAVVEMFLGPWWLGVRAVCRVVQVFDEPDRVGFAYGTLPGHAESGEEAFVLERVGDVTSFTVRAFSRPVTRMARLGGPATGLVQGVMAERYLKAVSGPRRDGLT